MDCCYQSPDTFLNLTDINVCGMVLGGIIALSNNIIYRRIAESTPCNISDYVVETFDALSGSYNFTISDGVNTELITSSETLFILGQNGVKVTVTPIDTVIVDGLKTYGTTDPSGTPVAPTQVNFYFNTTTNALFGWNPISNSWQQLIAGFAGSGSPLPVANFTLTKRALTAIANATSSTSTQQAVSLTYLWTSTPSLGVSFSASTGSTTNITFANPGNYEIVLTVTDALGHTATESRLVSVDRTLNVKGSYIDENGFDTLAAAINWLTTNDSANADKYTIYINSLTSDSSPVTITNNAKIKFNAGGRIDVKLIIAANIGLEYNWSGVSQNFIAINSSLDNCIEVPSNSKLYLNNLRINTNTNTKSCIINTGGNSVTLDLFNVRLTGSGTGITSIDGVTTTANNVRITKSSIDTKIGININKVTDLYIDSVVSYVTDQSMNLTNCTGVVKDSYFESTTTTSSMIILATSNLIFNSVFARFSNNAASSSFYAVMHISSSGLVLKLMHVTLDGNNSSGLIVLNSITSANISVSQSEIKGNVALGIYSTIPTSATWSNAKLYNNIIEGTINGSITYAPATTTGNNNTLI